ncbi:hypothetical protein ABD91_21480 [Lysinibacillus sphaericus]|nr:hypothetical protein [Lysinibacillus sphaericus]
MPFFEAMGLDLFDNKNLIFHNHENTLVWSTFFDAYLSPFGAVNRFPRFGIESSEQSAIGEGDIAVCVFGMGDWCYAVLLKKVKKFFSSFFHCFIIKIRH